MSASTETDLVGSTPKSEDLRRQAKVVKEDLQGLGRTATKVAKDKLGNVKEKAAAYVDEGKHKTTEFYEQGKKKASEVEDQVESYIREKPLKSVLIAAGAGVLLGFLLSRR